MAQLLYAFRPRAPAAPTDARPVTAAELSGVHSKAHLDRLDATLDGSCLSLDGGSYAGRGTREAMLRAARGEAQLGRTLMQSEKRDLMFVSLASGDVLRM